MPQYHPGVNIKTGSQHILNRITRREIAHNKGYEGHAEHDKDQADEAFNQKSSHDVFLFSSTEGS
jgi:hypothetical protein